MARVLPVLWAALWLAACSSSTNKVPATGPCQITTAGTSAPHYSSLADAMAAYTRYSPDSVVQATLDDAAWLRMVGNADVIEKEHYSYFEKGYTTFQVQLRPRDYTKPTQESFVLTDSQGYQGRTNPVTFKSSMGVEKRLEGDRWDYSFELSFQHVLNADIRWIRLTRELDGESVEWQFSQ